MTIETKIDGLMAQQLVEMYRRMWLIRHFDRRALELYREGLIRGSTHPYIGMEAVAVGACAALQPTDYITSTHRGHGHCIAKGGDIRLMMAELLGRSTGYCKGKGGSMHIADVDAGILGANGIVGGGMGIATGAALSAKMRGSEQVCLCFFGDGAINQGALYENANIAAIWKLPVVYVCENNQYAMSTPVQESTALPDLSVRAAAWGFPGISADGMDALAVYQTVAEAVARARAGLGPSLVVCNTYRYYGHHTGDPLNYRSKTEVEEWRTRDAIKRIKDTLVSEGVLTDEAARSIEAETSAAVDAAIEFAKTSPEPDTATLMDDVYA